MSGSPPLRFLAVVLGGWAALRIALIAPPWPAPAADAAPVVAAQGFARPLPRPERKAGAVKSERVAPAVLPISTASTKPPPRASGRRPGSTGTARLPAPPPALTVKRAMVAARAFRPFPASPGTPAATPVPAPTPARRWSLSAWSFVRRGGSTALASGGLLGGSQAGARLTYRLNGDPARPLALSFRLSAALRRAPAAEAAVGLDWQPDRRLPVRLLAERRQALSRGGRSAFAVTVHGGVGDAPLGPFRLDAYGQAGLVGARSRDPFADGSLRLSLRLGDRVRIGGGAWAAAQPGASRVDLGPQAALRLPVAGRPLTVAADWRVRIAGNARPGPGPTLTLATDF